jgi:predicted TIM-barrel fold metal-dependent hydrolase
MDKLDFSELPVVDDHCHLFNTQYSPHDLAHLLSMSLNDMPDEQVKQTLIYRRMLRELRVFLGQAGASDQEVLAVREARMLANYGLWVKDLFADAGIRSLLVDLGYKPAEVNLADFEGLVPARVYYMFRMESVLDDLWKELAGGRIDFRQVEDSYLAALDQAVATPNLVAVKSIIGYRTGLAVKPVGRVQMIAAPPSEKTFRDYFLLQTLVKLKTRGLPLQLHAAFGESNIDIRRNHPAMLKNLLDHPDYRPVRIVLVHGGYPHCFEAGYLASVYPNLYVDISEMFPFVPRGALRGLADIFDMCPFSKVLCGSDGFILPEIHWLGAKMVKEALSQLFTEYLDAGLVDRDLAYQMARMVFAENAQALYGLESAVNHG